MPAAKLGMWLFLASEAMFFIGLLGSFIVLESAGQQHDLFVKSSQILEKGMGIGGVLILALSSALIAFRHRKSRCAAITLALLFLLIQGLQWRSLIEHRTIVGHGSEQLQVIDGFTNYIGSESGALSHAMSMPMVQGLNIHNATPAGLIALGARPGEVYLGDRVNLDLNYGPSRNNFFACYFLMSAAHVLHLLAGIVAVLWFMLFAKGRLPDAVQIYWHFVNAVGLIAFLALYFV